MTGINAEAVESIAEDLQERYGEVPLERDPVELPADEFEEAVEHAKEGYDGGAYAWVVRDPEEAAELSETFLGDRGDRKRALLHLPRGSDEWGIPGGGREGQESFEEAAVREVREETGIDCEITGLWMLRHHVWGSEDEGDDRTTHSIHPFFDARYVGGHIEIQPGEANGAAWFAELPERMMAANEVRAETWDP